MRIFTVLWMSFILTMPHTENIFGTYDAGNEHPPIVQGNPSGENSTHFFVNGVAMFRLLTNGVVTS